MVNQLETLLKPVFQTAIETVTQKGIYSQEIEAKSFLLFADVAESILREAKDGGY